MQCSKCKNESVISQPYSGQHLCRDHFIIDIEAKAKRIIRQRRWMLPGDFIAVANTGTIADNALLAFFQKLARGRRDIRVTSLTAAGKISDVVAAAHDSGITRIAVATSLETASASFLTTILRGDPEDCTCSGAACPGSPELITPFCHIPATEIELYARIHGLNGLPCVLSMDDDPLLREVTVMLATYSQRHPAAPHALLNLCEVLRDAGHQEH